MRILIFTDNYLPFIGGVEVFTLNLIKGLRERGVQVTLVTAKLSAKSPKEEDFRGAKIIRLPFREWLGGNATFYGTIKNEILKIKREFKPNLINVQNFGATSFFNHVTSGIFPAPTVATLHGVNQLIHGGPQLVQKYFKKFDGIVAVSEFLYKSFIGLFPEFRDCSIYINNALPMPRTSPAPLPWDPPTILMMGRLSPEKGMDIGVQAFSKVLKYLPEVQLLIAGAGPEKENLEKQCFHLSTPSKVKFLGPICPENIPDVLNKSTILIVPSLFEEPFGLVALEGAQMGRPVVASNQGALSDIIQNNETGLLVPAGDSDALSKALIRLLKQPDLAKQMGQTGRKWAKKNFSYVNMLDQYLSYFERILGGNKGQFSEKKTLVI